MNQFDQGSVVKKANVYFGGRCVNHVRAGGRVRHGLVALLALGLAACSTTQLVYNKLDWFAAWQIGTYVELQGPSEALFENGFASLWRWHRATQLSLYAKDLRELADAAGSRLSPEQIQDFVRRANDHVEHLLDEGLPGAVNVFQALDDAQIAGLLKRMAERRAERAEEDSELDASERQNRTNKDMQKGLKRWLGAISTAQKERVQNWVAGRPSDLELWRRYNEQWAAAFAELLVARSQTDFGTRLRGLLLDPNLPATEAVNELRLRYNQSAAELMSEVSGTLSPKQRAHFQSELRALAQDLETLAMERG